MRVVHVAQPTTAGVARVVGQLVRDQVVRGWHVSVACPDGGELRAAAEAAGATWLPWEATRSPGRSTAGEARRLAGLLRRARPEVVHLHSSKAGLAGRLALRGRVPTVFQPHAWSFLAVEGPAASLALRWERAGARWAHALAVVSADEQAAGERAGVRGRWERLPNGVDLAVRPPADDAARERARADLGLPAGPLAVCVGRLARQKGQDVLLDAWPTVAAAVPGARLALVGDGPDREALAARAGDDVLLAGDAADADPWLRAADVVVLPSRWEAGLTLVAMEAMALARSVVATRTAGAQEGLAGAGEVVDVDDAAALARATARRLADPALAREEGRRGRRHVEEHHDLRRTTARAADLYGRLRA